MSQVIDRPTRGEAILGLLVTSASELTGDTKIGGSLGCRDQASVVLAVLRDMGQVRSKVRRLNFKNSEFQVYRERVSGIPWETALADKGAEQSWQFSKEVFRGVQELAIPRSKKLVKECETLAWLSMDSLVKLKRKKKISRELKLAQVT